MTCRFTLKQLDNSLLIALHDGNLELIVTWLDAAT